jgi:hypothetical protein
LELSSIPNLDVNASINDLPESKDNKRPVTDGADGTREMELQRLALDIYSLFIESEPRTAPHQINISSDLRKTTGNALRLTLNNETQSYECGLPLNPDALHVFDKAYEVVLELISQNGFRRFLQRTDTKRLMDNVQIAQSLTGDVLPLTVIESSKATSDSEPIVE